MEYVLAVDDSKVVRSVCRKILEELGFNVEEAEDGKAALEECSKRIPKAILLDWNMPVMNGMEFLKEFRKMEGNEVTKVIFCTTENEIAKIQEALTEGANEYVMKPFDAEIIKNKFVQLGLLE